jgi:ribosome maturation factor RimP
MISTNLIRELAENKLKESDNYLVDVTVSAMNKIRITIDNFRGVSIQECVGMSRWIENQLGETEDFELEVSSPGLDQPFKVLQQYQKYAGKEVEVKFTDGQKTEGKLIASNENEIELEQTVKENKEGKKGKQTVIKKVVIPFEKIKETKIIIKF